MVDNSSNNIAELQEQIQQARSAKKQLIIRGGGSKNFYGFSSQNVENCELLSTKSHQGIISYEPNELVLTARAGTPLKEIEKCLAENNQMLSCEAPHFGENATFGGMIAAGISGPARPFTSSISDLILGCKIINGQAEILQFGGKVMKNVAGYDHSRLMAGSMGCLGLIVEATVKVVPSWPATRSFRFSIEKNNMRIILNKMTTIGLPISAMAYENNTLLIRFSAGYNETERLNDSLKNLFSTMHFEEDSNKNYWADLREHKHEFFSDEQNIWRLSQAPNTIGLGLEGSELIEWNGAQRWLKTAAEEKEVFAKAATMNVSATLFRHRSDSIPTSIFQPLSKPLMHWQKQLKKAFDPDRLFNPGRMYRDF